MSNGPSTTGSINGDGTPNMLDAVEDLIRAGVEEGHAKAIVKMQYRLIESHLSTKQDLEVTKMELKRDILATKQDLEVTKMELKRDILATKQDLEVTKMELKRDILATKQDLEVTKMELKRDIEVTKKDLKIWMGSWALGALAALVALAKLGLLTPA